MSASNGGRLETAGEARPEQPEPPIVGIGASAGGLAALRELFAAVPPNSGAAFVVIQHLDPTRESQLVSLLAQSTAMPVATIADGGKPRADHVYVIGPNAVVSMRDGALRVTEPVEPRGLRRPIDHFFESLAQSWGTRAVGVVLSGTGSDGTRGLLSIKHAGGLALVQEPSSAGHDGMPLSAIGAGATDFVVEIRAMPEVIGRYLERSSEPADLEASGEQLTVVLDIVQSETGHALHRYRPNTLRRRILRRMDMNGVGDLDAYVELLRGNREEVRRLFGDLLIGVTAFFREAEVFETLESEVIPAIIERKSDEEPIRVWVPGCATGEEAYSIAMLFLEKLATSGKSCALQVFATDVDESALDTARQGLYTAERVADIDDARRERFFKKERGAYRASRDLRDAVVFAPQNLLSDPPFSQMDLVSCRNLLIYLVPEIQRKVTALFHFALSAGGFLVLGSAETLGRRNLLFEPISEVHRIYRRKDTAVRGPLELPLGTGFVRRGAGSHRATGPMPHTTLRELTNRALLADFAPAAAVVDGAGEILYISGDVDPFLAVSAGEPTRNLTDLVRRGLRGAVRSSLDEVAREGAGATECIAQVKIGERYRDVLVRMKPLRDAGPGPLYLATFEQLPDGASPAVAVTDESVVAQLEAELRATRDDLQSTIEELGASNEELRASNEEVLSMNEELQSANEELETSKEELQSLNEELTTVNAQLQDKLEELARANNDIENLLASADLATLFLDRDLRIKRFTAATRRLFNLIPSDAGRAITDITTRYSGLDLAARARAVLESLVPDEAEVRDDSGAWYSCRVLPYRTSDDRIEGVVVTFADIGVQKRAEDRMLTANEELEARVAERTAELAEAVVALEEEVRERGRIQEALRAERDRVDSILATAVDAIVTIDQHGTIEMCNAAAEEMFGYVPGELVGQSVGVLMTDADRHRHHEYIERYLRTGTGTIIGAGRQVMGRRKDGAVFPIDLSVGEMSEGPVRRFTGVLRDITGRQRLEEELRQNQKMEAVGRLASGIAHDFNNLLMGISGCANLGLSRLPADSPVRAYFKEIREAAVSGASITRHLLAFARKREERLEPIDLNEAVTHARALLVRLIGEDIELEVSLADRALWVRWDLGQLEQVLLNLAVNARDAMPSGGRLVIAASQVELDVEAIARYGDLKPGTHAMVSVSDSGVGIAEEIRAHIFEPFFTTKDPEIGTGLGLSTVYGLVKQAAGHIEITSKVGAGTSFEIILPVVDPPVQVAGDAIAAAGGDETALIVEDDPLVRLTLRHYLEQNGYATLDANDATEALEICDAQSAPFALLITDVSLPGMSGPELARQVAQRFPDVPALFVSGHPPDMIRERMPPGAEVLQKPFSSEALVSRVRAILDAAASRQPPRKRATVLVVEDNENARAASRELIEDMGYRVLDADTAAGALDRVAEHDGPIDAVIVDLGLPDLSGDKLVAKLSATCHPRCVIYVSGRSSYEPEITRLVESDGTHFLEKPWEPEELEALLERALS